MSEQYLNQGRRVITEYGQQDGDFIYSNFGLSSGCYAESHKWKDNLYIDLLQCSNNRHMKSVVPMKENIDVGDNL